MGSAELHGAGTRISQCSNCASPLPLCEAVNPEELRLWICSQCGTEFHAALATDYSIDELRGIRPAAINFDGSSIPPVAPEMLEFARQLNARVDTNVEKRTSTRHPIIATLKAMEFDEQLRPTSPPFHTICRNLSTGGISLINDRAVRSAFLVIELSAAGRVPIQTLGQVLRRRPLGPYHDIGSAFLTKLATANAAAPSR